MNRRIINGPGYCALTENGKLMEYIRYEEGDQSGAVMLGRIDRMMPGMNCAFVDIGRTKNGFLPLNEDSGSFAGGNIKSGDTILVQIKKEEKGQKGAFLTRDITIPGSLCIIMPMNRYIGVSSRVNDEERKERLKKTGHQIADGRFGIVMRNASVGADTDEIQDEAERLYSVWMEIREKKAEGGKPGRVLWADNPLNRMKEDYAAGGFETVTYQEDPGPEILQQLKLAGDRTVTLPGGGNIVIDRCEAMTVIDVNTASFAGMGSKERTVLETNLEACDVIAQQARIRNLGGIILIDFIDMDNETDRSLVLDRLAESFAPDRIKTVLHGWTRLGLMEMTRKRTGIEKMG